MPSVKKEVYVGYIDVNVELEDFDTDELQEELERRSKNSVTNVYVESLLHSIYEKRRNNRDYQQELSALLHETIGRIS